jgi:hypothetical protein
MVLVATHAPAIQLDIVIPLRSWSVDSAKIVLLLLELCEDDCVTTLPT